MAITGYQSDVALSDVLGQNNIPAQNNRGSFTSASATGTPNLYAAALEPPLTRAYSIGLRLEVEFDTGNTAVAISQLKTPKLFLTK